MLPETKRTTWVLAGLLALACGVFLTGIQWGLPSRSADQFLFGDRAPWTGQQILALAPQWSEDANRAADVAAHPLEGRDQAILVNQTDSQRAAIVRRYRLYSDQPDEMITLRALAQVKPGKLQFDPKLYQYGGLWIYPLGGLLKIASLLHLVRVTNDLGFYLDHPEAFGRLYVVMRLYSAGWGLVGVVVMFSLASRITASRCIGTIAAICYTLLPTVINAAHEAKPHLAGAVLGLIAVDFATRASDSRRKGWAIAAGVACGACAGMVLSGWLSVGLLPAMALCMLKRSSSGALNDPPFYPAPEVCTHAVGKRVRNAVNILAISSLASVVTYSICNPYVILHLLGDRAVLVSNLGNSAAMYQVRASVGGLFHGVGLLFDGGSIVILIGICGIGSSLRRQLSVGFLLLAAMLPGLCVFLAHATGKPGEYGRFALPFDVLFVLGAVFLPRDCGGTRERIVIALVTSLILLPTAASYVLNFGQDTFGNSTRLRMAERLQYWSSVGASTLAVDAEPAPYVLPPVDLFRWKIVLLPHGAAMPRDADVRIDPTDGVGPDLAAVQSLVSPLFLSTPISWAGKCFRIEIRQGVLSAAKAGH